VKGRTLPSFPNPDKPSCTIYTRQKINSEKNGDSMTEKITEQLKVAVLACAACFSYNLKRLLKTLCSILTFIGLTVSTLVCFSAADKKYTFTFDYDPFVFSIEPMDRVEQKFREADQAKQAEKMVRR